MSTVKVRTLIGKELGYIGCLDKAGDTGPLNLNELSLPKEVAFPSPAKEINFALSKEL